MKYCPGCATNKLLDAFSKDSSRKDGRQSYCKACQKLRRPDPEKERERVNRRNAENREYARAVCRRSYRKHRAKRLKKMAAWRVGGNGYASVKRWREANPDAVKVMNQNRRAREKGAEGSHTKTEWWTKCEAYGQRCAYCRKKRKLTEHHVQPLAKGGSNYIDNIVPACGPCNSRIGTKTVKPPEVCHH